MGLLRVLEVMRELQRKELTPRPQKEERNVGGLARFFLSPKLSELVADESGEDFKAKCSRTLPDCDSGVD